MEHLVKLIRKLIAFFRRTFVADCPRCHRYFFGFHPHGVQMRFDNTHYRIVCHLCAVEHKSLTQKK